MLKFVYEFLNSHNQFIFNIEFLMLITINKFSYRGYSFSLEVCRIVLALTPSSLTGMNLYLTRRNKLF